MALKQIKKLSTPVNNVPLRLNLKETVEKAMSPREKIHDVLKKIQEDDDSMEYVVLDDLSVNIKGDLYLDKHHFHDISDYIKDGHLPFKVNKVVDGMCVVAGISEITSLKNFPLTVESNMIIGGLSSLETLVGGPKEILEGDFQILNCPKLKNLVGAPVAVNGSVKLSSLKNLQSLEGAPKQITRLELSDLPQIDTLEYFHQLFPTINGTISLDKMTIKPSGVLGFLRVNGLRQIYNNNVYPNKVIEIVNSYLQDSTKKRKMLDCQAELTEAGFDDYATI